MAVTHYSIQLLRYEHCSIRFEPPQMIEYLRAWRHHHDFATECCKCQRPLAFRYHFTLCCDCFYYDARLPHYPIESIAVATPGYTFALPQLERALARHRIVSDQQHLVVPDPIYWQVPTTLVLEKMMKFVMGIPITKRTTLVQPAFKSKLFYKQLMDAPLNYGSLADRSTGKNTFMRQYAFGKRTSDANRGVIVPDAMLKPNEVTLPEETVQKYNLWGKYIVVGRMPTLQPENKRCLKVVKAWNRPCIGLPLEIVEGMNADFDGDECNIYILHNLQSQAECATLLNSEKVMGSFNTGLKLAPSQDMLVAFYLFYDQIDFLPYKTRDLRETFRVIYDLYGSRTTFECFDKMRLFYLDVLENKYFFALSLTELHSLNQLAQCKTSFLEKAKDIPSCLVTQIESGAKGSFEHLYQLFGHIDQQASSFWTGLTPREAVSHALTSVDALSQQSKIWEPGYGYSKSVYNLQGLHVDYAGRLMDGRRVVQSDALNAMHYTDMMSTAGFRELMRVSFEAKQKTLKVDTQ